MTDNQDRVNQLLDKLDILLKRQDTFSREINELREEVTRLKTTGAENKNKEEDKEVEEQKEESPATSFNQYSNQHTEQKFSIFTNPKVSNPTFGSKQKVNSPPSETKSDIEKFIGENIINKIGIVITVIGVAIGAKYAIDHELISPLTRIIIGYLFGFGLLGFAIKLKKKYDDFSAVLLSGSMATMYFITYAAYSFYDLIPQVLAFSLMVIFTIFTVLSAINYNRQVIAHVGLVGAYAVPFLLSKDPGAVVILFSYIAIINIGILAISFKKYWKPLYYSSFAFTWLIFIRWQSAEYVTNEHFSLALTFLSIFFVIFYLTFLSYKLLRKEKFENGDILLLLANSFIFFGIGYYTLNNHIVGEQLLGLFTLCNAIIHFIVSTIVYKHKLADRNLLYLISGLVLVFITIAIPVQLDGNWVTLLWAGEAALLFWIGRTKGVHIYEKMSYPLIVIAVFSILHDWSNVYDSNRLWATEIRMTPIFNVNFLSCILFIAAFGFIYVLNRNKKYTFQLDTNLRVLKIVSITVPAIILFTIYFIFRLEIANYWNQLFADSAIKVNVEGQRSLKHFRNYDLRKFKSIWIINYSLLFFTILSFVNLIKLRNKQLGIINLGFNALSILFFLAGGLYLFSELRESYLEQTLSEYYHIGIFNIGIRYVSYTFIASTLIACYKYILQEFKTQNFKMAFDFLLYISILWIASSELINWMDIGESSQSYKLGLSILWGIYSLLLIAIGIWKKIIYIRIGAIVLFGVTLLKLFFYDISHLNTIAKTVVFISLGILLLIISFLYNKYKHIISDVAEN
jgi:hypothetical protein